MLSSERASQRLCMDRRKLVKLTIGQPQILSLQAKIYLSYVTWALT